MELKLNLGSGNKPLPNYQNIDRKDGQEVYPLGYPYNSADEIRASHVLEHFSHREVSEVLRDWVKVLKPGGVLKIAVPDFDKIIEWYKAERTDLPLLAYLMGGQTNDDDFHRSAFNEDGLRAEMEAAGLMDIERWESDTEDCSSLEVSLNLQGRKPVAETIPDTPAQVESISALESIPPVKVHAVASVPRLGFNATWHCAITSLNALGIDLTMLEGVFWQQCLTRGIETAIAAGADYILTMDYDSVFTTAQVHRLCQLAIENPQYQAIVPVQVKRESDSPLFKLNGSRDFSKTLTPIATGHFGLTIFDAKAFASLSKPWFHDQPNVNGDWGEGRTDADIWFWAQWGRAGLKVALANEVRIGHLELGITWPGADFQPVRQSLSAYRDTGQPKECGGGLKVKLIGG